MADLFADIENAVLRDERKQKTLVLVCGSPIEKSFVETLVSFCEDGERLRTQVACGPYAIDVTVELDGVKLAVELDGHEWHERTKEQAAKDKARDRFLVRKGYRVLRFTGSEIHKDVGRCAIEVLNILHELLNPEDV